MLIMLRRAIPIRIRDADSSDSDYILFWQHCKSLLPTCRQSLASIPITEALFCSQVVVVAVVVAAVVCFCFHFNNQIKIQCNPLAAKRKRAPKLAAPTVPSSAPCHLSGLSTCCRLVFLGFSISFCERQLNSPFGPTCFNIVSSRHTFSSSYGLFLWSKHFAGEFKASFGKRERELGDRLLCIIVLCFSYSSTAHKHATPTHAHAHVHASLISILFK